MYSQSEHLDKMIPDLIAAQAEIPVIPKGDYNAFFKSKFANLAQVWGRSVTGALNKHSIAVIQSPDVTFDDLSAILKPSQTGKSENIQVTSLAWVVMTTRLIHASGQFVENSIKSPVKSTDAQGIASAITYLRRYGLMCLAGIVSDDDDDGNSAAGKEAPQGPAGSFPAKGGPSQDPVPTQQPPKASQPPAQPPKQQETPPVGLITKSEKDELGKELAKIGVAPKTPAADCWKAWLAATYKIGGINEVRREMLPGIMATVKKNPKQITEFKVGISKSNTDTPSWDNAQDAPYNQPQGGAA